MLKAIFLKGCFPPIPTPFDKKGRVDHDHLVHNLEKWQETPLAGFAVLGSNGEAVFLKEEEKIETWKKARCTVNHAAKQRCCCRIKSSLAPNEPP